MMAALEIRGLEKSYPSTFGTRRIPVLRGIDLTVAPGEIYGFLGPNGAGKTTTIKCILGLLRPDRGSIRLLGRDADSLESRRNLGFLPENPYFYEYLTIRELLHFTGRLFCMSGADRKRRVEEVLRQAGLWGREETKLGKCSKGMIQRAGLAQALVQDPEVLILDEPFSGLDPVGRKELRDLVLSLKSSGRTIFFSSHILQDMELMVDRVAIIINGRLVREGRLDELVSRSVRHYELVVDGVDEKDAARTGLAGERRDNHTIIRVESLEEVNQKIRAVHVLSGRIAAMIPVKLTLEDIFMREIGK
ncbi:MAG TPA: ABC transporter ATP-binding protein [Candidatus Aminicenantes bacterium]|nr:ABC transporter ATP-binding protein [Candidatus Aminicenantes bacterium]